MKRGRRGRVIKRGMRRGIETSRGIAYCLVLRVLVLGVLL